MIAQAHLDVAVAVEDSMGYAEPPRQYQPVRHCLGYVLLLKGDQEAARKVRSSAGCPGRSRGASVLD